MPSLEKALILAAASLVASAAATVFASWMLVRLPADYFAAGRPTPVAPLALRVLKNLAGVAVIVVGLTMAIPGVPGPGLLTALVGLLLIDFPGKYGFERRIIRLPWVRRGVDRLRQKYGRAPFQL